IRCRTESVDAPRQQGARLRMGGDTPGLFAEKFRSVPLVARSATKLERMQRRSNAKGFARRCTRFPAIPAARLRVLRETFMLGAAPKNHRNELARGGGSHGTDRAHVADRHHEG